jgi:pimeloyl-ACP methyl ester carboxylesterase
VRGRPLGCFHLVTFNADGTQHVAAHYRPLSSLMFFSRLLRERFAVAATATPTYLLAGLIPQARVKIYPDAAHGFLFQHHAEFARDADAFLKE